MTRAFPLLLGPSWSRATSQAAEQSELVLQIWLVQVSLSVLLLTCVTVCLKLPALDKHDRYAGCYRWQLADTVQQTT